jgi:hypothetical protein
MSSEEELKKVESLAKNIAKIMEFDDPDLTVEKDKTGTVEYMGIILDYPFSFTPQSIVGYVKEKIIEKIINKKNNPKSTSSLKATIVLGKNYELKIEEKLTHELGHARFLKDHPFIQLILEFLSLPYDTLFVHDSNEKTKTGIRYVAKILPLIISQYGFVSLLANHINEYIAGYEGRKRGLESLSFVPYHFNGSR